MYSERDKIRYLEMMWAEGLSYRAAERKFGPTYTTLRIWEQQALEGKLDAVMPPIKHRCEHKKHCRYPKDTKAEAIRLYKLGEKPQHIAKRLGIANSNFPRLWAQKEEAESKIDAPKSKKSSKESSVGKKKDSPPEVLKLKAELEEARFELQVYKEIITNPKVSSPENLSKKQLSELAEKLRQVSGYSLQQILTYLGISKSTFHYHRKKRNSDPALSQVTLDKHVKRVFTDNKARYGYRRIVSALKLEGIYAPERKVRSSMKRQGLIAHSTKAKKKWSSYAGEISEAPANLLLNKYKRHVFKADAPNKIWLTDITEMKGRNGKCYLSAIIDCYDGKVVAWKTSTRPSGEFANSTLLDAIATLSPDERPIIHSDRGLHYRSKEWIAICDKYRLIRSMSRKGHSPDNAACEGFFGRAKVECIFELTQAGALVEEIMAAVDEYVVWYNNIRLKAFKINGRIIYESIDSYRSRKAWVA